MKTTLRYLRILSFGLSFVILGVSCKSAETKQQRAEALASLEEVLTEKNYRVDVSSVLPFNSAATQQVLNELLRYRFGDNPSRINVAGQGYFVSSKDSTMQAYLPYFGEQRMVGGHYGRTDQGIKFDTAPMNYKMYKHKRKDAFVIKYTVKDNIDNLETYDVIMTIFPSENVDIMINSSHRMNINYRGTLELIE